MYLPSTLYSFIKFAVLFLVGVRDQALDWMTAPPVHVLSYLVLGSEKDAKSSVVSGASFYIVAVLSAIPDYCVHI